MNEVKYTILEGNKLKVENLRNRDIIYRNFSGKPSQYNRNGNLKFSLVIDPAIAPKLQREGWNVKSRPSKNDDGEEFCTLEVRVRFDLSFARPKIRQFTRGGSIVINEHNVGNFDDAEFETADIVLRQYAWTNPAGESGISAQLSEMYVRLNEGVLAEKWGDMGGEDNGLPFDFDEPRQ